MERTRQRSFEREIGAVSRVAGAATAPLQLSLDEQLPGKVHGWAPIVVGDYGYRRPCECGWPGTEYAKKVQADNALRAHIGRTPQGTAVLKTVRRFGRGGHGA